MTKELKNILSGAKILLIEDDIEFRTTFARLLSLYVEKIYEAKDGVEALEICKENMIDVVFSDTEMPNMGVFKFTSKIREISEDMPIVIVSASSEKTYLLEAIRLSISDYLIKPVRYDELLIVLEKIAKILKKRILVSEVSIKNFFYNPKNKEIKLNDRVIRLSKTESELVDLLLLNRGELVDKNMIENFVYKNKYMSDTAIKNVIYKIRYKIGADIIKTVDKIGYMIEKD